jgi:hypothetical protein
MASQRDAAPPTEARPRGLKAIEEARQARGKLRFPPARFWGWAAVVLVVSAILHWKWSQGQLESARQRLMAEQRAVAAELGQRWSAMRGSVERWTLELAREPGPEVIDREALAGWDFRERPGLYLRLRVDEAKDVETLRKALKSSLRDAFTACLMRVPNPSPLAGPECKRTRDCAVGQLCNELDRCSPPAQPYNLRVAYRTMSVLSDEWVRDVQDASTELRLRLLGGMFEDTVRDDLPIAVDLLARAQYLLVVLDEPVPGLVVPDGGSPTLALQAVPHTARVGVWRLSDGKNVLRIRREAGGQLLGGTPAAVGDDVLDARQRQANSCALALAVRQAMGDASAAAAPAARP